MKTTRAERHAALLASLTLLGCRDALQPVGPRVPAPSAAIEPAPPPATNECASPPVGTIWCDDFEVDRLSSYFEHLSPTTFARTAGVGAGGSYGMRAVYTPGVPQAGDLKLAFGRSPDPDYMKPVGYGAPAYREIYWRAYLRAQPGWTGGGGGAFTRAMVLASAVGARRARRWCRASPAPRERAARRTTGPRPRSPRREPRRFPWSGCSSRPRTPACPARPSGRTRCCRRPGPRRDR